MIPTGESSPGNTIAKQICLDDRDRASGVFDEPLKPSIDKGAADEPRHRRGQSEKSAGASDARSSGADR
jgi:hypothetical protein